MAKTQTFSDKNKKKKDEFISVKIVATEKTPKGSFKFSERFIKVKDLADVEQAVKA